MIRAIKTFRSTSLMTQVVITVLCLLGYFLSNYFLELSYINSKFPVPFFEQQTSFDAVKMKGWYSHMISEGTFGVYLQTQLIDFVFILTVILGGFTLWTFIANLHPVDNFFRRWGYSIAFALPLAGAFDVLENLVSFMMMANPAGFADVLMIPYSSFACLKFACWVVGLLWLIFSIVALPVTRFRSARKYAVLGFALLGMAQVGNAQSNIQEESSNQLIYVEVDPLAYINKGYSVHLGYENWGFRFDLTKVKVDYPESFEDAFYGTTAFDLVTNISGIKVDYIGKRTNWTKGAFIGVDINSQKLEFTHRPTKIGEELTAMNVGVRAGYKINFYKGFYMTPWAAVWKNIAKEKTINVSEDSVSTLRWDWIATLHFGYAVKF